MSFVIKFWTEYVFLSLTVQYCGLETKFSIGGRPWWWWNSEHLAAWYGDYPDGREAGGVLVFKSKLLGTHCFAE